MSTDIDRIAFVDGEYRLQSEATISILDHGILYADGVFDTMVAISGSVFKLDAHLDRLFRSMRAVAIDPPYDREELRQHILETVRRNDLTDAYIKCVVTRGSNGRPLMDPTGCVPTCFIIVMPYVSKISAEQRETGIRLQTVSLRRAAPDAVDARIKSLNYLGLVLGKIEARAGGSDEALFLDTRGYVAEATGANLVAVIDGALRSPESDALPGITRETVLELAAGMGRKCSIEPMTLYDVYNASEVMLTSTAGGVIPVAQIDGRPIGSGCSGPVTKRLHEAYRVRVASGSDRTPIDAVAAA